jgi:serine/threonine-protein kinase
MAITRTRHTVPPHVEAAVHKALAKVPADRFATAAQFAEALTNPGFMPPTPSREITGVRIPTAWSRLTVGFASLSGVLAALLLVVLWSGSRPGPAPHVARLSLRLPSEEALALTPRQGLAFAPDGSRFVYAGLNEGTVQLFLRELGDFQARPLRGTEDGCCAMFSPDGQSLAFINDLGELKVVSLGGGPVVTVVDSGLTDLVLYGGGVDWGADGFLYATGLEGLVRVAPQGGPLERITTLDRERGDRTHAAPDVLPNGKGALVTVIPQDASDDRPYAIGVADFATGAVTIVLEGIFARYAVSGHVIFVQDDGAVLAAPFDQDRLAVTGPAVPLIENVVRNQTLGMAELALSETGSLLYATGRPLVNRLVWVDRDGRAEEIDPGWTGLFLDPVLSSDESHVALSVTTALGQHVWIKPLDASPASRLTFSGSVNLRALWTLDDQSVMFVSDRSGPSLLYQKRADGATAATLIPFYDERAVFGVELSLDGNWLIFRTDNQAPGNGDILALARGDTVPVELLATPAEEEAPTLSPDGRWLAYTSDESGRREVYVRPFPNVSDARQLVSPNGGSEPLWAHSGRELFYRAADDNLIAVQVVRDPAFSLGTQRRLFSVARYQPDPFSRSYDVTRNDQRFVMVRQEVGDNEGELILVLNWLEEVKREVGGR